VSGQDGFLVGARPSFAPRATGGGRIAVVDVGSNSVRLVVFDRAARTPAYFFNEKTSCGLGARIAETGRLDPDGVTLALATLRRFVALADRMHVSALDAVATAAVREAEDGPAFAARVERETGLRLRVLPGDEEARLSALGVLLGLPDAEGAAVDMGGASMEAAQLAGGAVGRRITLALGPQRLAGLSGAALRKRVDAEVARAGEVVSVEGRPLYMVGGSWRALAKIHMGRVKHPLQVIHAYRIAADDAAAFADWTAAQTPEALKAAADVSAGRAATAPLASLVLGRLIAGLKPSALVFSAFGLREGVYFERLAPSVRALDPLIEAARDLEATQARFPGFGEELAAFVAPVVAAWPADERRLARAACLLNDVNWRTHPDYRPVSCFETVTRANLAGLDHPGRVFVGFALLNRYGGGKRSADVEEALALLGPGPKARAKALGRALRLGAMLSASAPGSLAGARLSVEEGRLTLALGETLAELSGGVVEKRLKALAEALELAPRLVG
jgi:exopolyphosphatase/guanosine-5'-triphosphate,3'-diphosphate pyrophosphatase